MGLSLFEKKIKCVDRAIFSNTNGYEKYSFFHAAYIGTIQEPVVLLFWPENPIKSKNMIITLKKIKCVGGVIFSNTLCI